MLGSASSPREENNSQFPRIQPGELLPVRLPSIQVMISKVICAREMLKLLYSAAMPLV
jgi:hypothetical protein